MKILTLEFWKGVFNDLIDFLTDLPVQILKGVLNGIATSFETLSPPDFMSQSLGDVLGPSMGFIGYFAAQAGVGQAMGLLAAGITFRLLRKVVTFGQW